MKRNLFLMYAISFSQGMVFYSSIATLYRQAAGLSVFQITLIESISLALSLVFEIPWGVLADRIGYRRTMIVCNVLFFISKIIFWQSQNFAGFLSERVLLAVVLSGLSGVDTSILYLSCSNRDSQRAFGIFDSCGTAGILSSAVIYLIFIGENYRTAAFLTIVSYGIAAVLSFGLREVKGAEREKPASVKHSLGILKETLLNRRLFLLIIAVSFFSEVNQTITVFFNQLQYTKAGMSARLISGIYIFITFSGLISVFSAPLTKKLNPRFFGALLFIICSLSCLMLACTKAPLVSIFGVFLVSVSYKLMSPLGTELQNKAITTTDRATALSMNSLIGSLLAIITNLVFGKLADLDLSAAMCFGGLLCMLGLILYLISLKSFSRRQATTTQ